MGRNRFVSPSSDRIPLSDGDWIEVKHDLNNGERLALEQAGNLPPIRDGQGGLITPIDWSRHELERAFIFLTDWSFRGADDKPVKLSIDALRAIDPDTFREINQAILSHSTRRAAEREEEKKQRAEAAASTMGMPTELASATTSGS
jgi:hypothetical protein